MLVGSPAPVDTDFLTWATGIAGEEGARAAAHYCAVALFHHDPGSLSAAFVQERLRRAADCRPRRTTRGEIGFAAASAIGGAATTSAMLFGARALQGVFAAVLAPSALSLLTTTSPTRRSAEGFGIYGALAGSGSAIGFIVGGVLAG
ncbi:hypothetical protein STENM327S_00017 [Streptomyces tendae]